MKKWKCEECGDKLPKRGLVWAKRFKDWLDSKRKSSGFYCDVCVETAREY